MSGYTLIIKTAEGRRGRGAEGQRRKSFEIFAPMPRIITNQPDMI